MLKTVDSIANITSILTPATISITGFSLKVIPIAKGVICGLTLGNKKRILLTEVYGKAKTIREGNKHLTFSKNPGKVYKIIDKKEDRLAFEISNIYVA